ncbi:hypothetical protein LSH36_519g03039, partial [Paralvinella palmiformis]
IEPLLERYKNDIRKTGGVVNNLIERTRNKNTIADKFIIDDNDINDPDVITNSFCKYITEIGKQLADKIPKGTKSFKEYIITNPNANSLYLVPTSSDEVLQMINSLTSKKSTGHDGISTRLLKQIRFAISTPLTVILNKSLENGEVPAPLKLAKVIYKAKENYIFNNYRPVSLSPCISKSLEKFIHNITYCTRVNMDFVRNTAQ